MSLVKLATYRENCYFYSGVDENDERIKVDCFQPNKGLSFYFEDSNMKFAIGPDDIYFDRANNISFDLGNTHYIIDDGYRFLLIRTGYIMRLDENGNPYKYDTDQDNYKIQKIKKVLTTDLRNALWRIGSTYNFSNDPETVPRVVNFTSVGYGFSFRTAKIEKHVSINEIRKRNKLPYFPYKTNIDKYCNLSFALYCQKLANGNEELTIGDAKYSISDNFLDDIRYQLGDEYKVETLPIKKRIILGKDCI